MSATTQLYLAVKDPISRIAIVNSLCEKKWYIYTIPSIGEEIIVYDEAGNGVNVGQLIKVEMEEGSGRSYNIRSSFFPRYMRDLFVRLDSSVKTTRQLTSP